MATTQRTIIGGIEEEQVTQKLRTRKVFGLFDVRWWENVSVESLGNDIHIQTQKEIRHIYVNGKLIR